jgi:hypothetical protein
LPAKEDRFFEESINDVGGATTRRAGDKNYFFTSWLPEVIEGCFSNEEVTVIINKRRGADADSWAAQDYMGISFTVSGSSGESPYEFSLKGTPDGTAPTVMLTGPSEILTGAFDVSGGVF